MKDLLCMSLVVIARAGLCLAALAWIAGQWRTAVGICALPVSTSANIR
ncbi:MAG: hypothetical protein ABGZ53_03040 [Fuerstiella sp.]